MVDEKEFEGQLAGFIDEIVKTAMEDSIISEDENKLIETIKQRIEDLKMVLSLSLENPEDLETFESLFDKTLEDIVNESITVAKDDLVITEEEIKIISKVIEFKDNRMS